MNRDPLDLAVDRACSALVEVARIAEQRAALDLSRVAFDAHTELLNAWECAE